MNKIVGFLVGILLLLDSALFGNSPLDLHSADLVNFGEQQTASLVLSPKFTKNHESQTENPSVVDSAKSQNLGKNYAKTAKSSLDSTPQSQNLTQNQSRVAQLKKSFCYFWLLPKVETPLPSNLNLQKKAISQNLAKQTIEGIAVEVAEFLPNFGRETGLDVRERSKFGKSMQDAPKSKLPLDSAKLDEFIISYRAIMKNNILIGEEFKVAKALTISQNPNIIAQCDIVEFSPDDSHIKTLKQNQSAILSCFEQTLHNKIRDDIKSINNEVRTKTTYKIPAQRILFDRQRSKIHIIGQK